MDPFRRFFVSLFLTGFSGVASARIGGSDLPDSHEKPSDKLARKADQLLELFHLSAAKANFSDYFWCLSEDAIYLGTDATERWTVEEFKAFAKPHFDKGTGWTYRKVDRHIQVSKDGNHASFDELLDNIPPKGKAGYGRCRGTGVLRMVRGEWKIEQYHLTIPIPNDLANQVVQLIREKGAKP